jgi:hypothetical protein
LNVERGQGDYLLSLKRLLQVDVTRAVMLIVFRLGRAADWRLLFEVAALTTSCES